MKGPPPNPLSANQRVRRYFRDNPDEELTYMDMMEKFSLSRNRVYELVKLMRSEELVEAVHIVRSIARAKL